MKNIKNLTILKKIYDINDSKGYFLISFFLMFQIIEIIPMLSELVKPFKNILFFLIVVSFLLLIFKNKYLTKFKGYYFLIFFLFWYLIVIFINRDLNIINNFKYYLYMLFQLIILVNYFNYSEMAEKKVFDIISFLIKIGSLILGISLILYFINFNDTYEINNTLYIIGSNKGRLTGLFGNANLIAVFSSVCLIVMIFLKKKGVLRIPIMIILVLCLALSQSRGTIIAFTISLSLFFVISRLKRLDKILTIKNILKFIIVLITTTMLLFFTTNLGRTITNFHLYRTKEIKTDKPIEQITGDRDFSDRLRMDLLFIGLNVFIDYPIFGVSASNIGHYGIPYVKKDLDIKLDNQILNNPHNIIVMTLASSGIIGLTLVVIYLVYFTKLSIGYIISKSYSDLNITLMAIIIFFLLISQLEWYIIFNSSLFASLFWIASGSIINFTRKKEIGQ